MKHGKALSAALRQLKALSGISRILLYGSVARGKHKESSDINLAVVLDDMLRALPYDSKFVPSGYHEQFDRIARSVEQAHGAKLHIAPYMEHDFETGTESSSQKKPSPRKLQETAVVLYDC